MVWHTKEMGVRVASGAPSSTTDLSKKMIWRRRRGVHDLDSAVASVCLGKHIWEAVMIGSRSWSCTGMAMGLGMSEEWAKSKPLSA